MVAKSKEVVGRHRSSLQKERPRRDQKGTNKKKERKKSRTFFTI